MATIKQLVDRVNVEYFLPIIQREYRWLKTLKDQKIEKYLDSLYKGYPGGTFIFYTVNKQQYTREQLLKFTENYRAGQICTNPIINKSEITRDNITLIYDGQQRITSLYIACKKGYMQKNNYFNMYFRVNNLEEHEKLEGTRFKFINCEDDVCIESNNNSEIHYVKLKKIFTIEASQIENLINSNNLQHIENSNENLHKLRKLIHEVEMRPEPCTYLRAENNTDPRAGYTEDQMFTIFARLNSGMPVKREELVLSFFYDTFININFREKINELEQKLKDDCHIDGFTTEKLLSSVMYFIKKDVKIKIDDINDEVTNLISEHFDSIKQKLLTSAQFIYQNLNYCNFKELKLSLRYPVEIVGYYTFAKNLTRISEEDKRAISEFIKLYQLKEWNKGNKVSERLKRVRDYIDNYNNFSEVLGKLQNHEGDRLKINESDIEGIMQLKYGDARLHYVLQLLFPNLAYSTIPFVVDHIFPKSREYDERKVNNIANLQFLSEHENSTEVKGATPPQNWFNLKSADEQQQLIANGLLTTDHLDNFDEFYNARKGLLEEKLRKMLEDGGGYRPEFTALNIDTHTNDIIVENNFGNKTPPHSDESQNNSTRNLNFPNTQEIKNIIELELIGRDRKLLRGAGIGFLINGKIIKYQMQNLAIADGLNPDDALPISEVFGEERIRNREIQETIEKYAKQYGFGARSGEFKREHPDIVEQIKSAFREYYQ